MSEVEFEVLAMPPGEDLSWQRSAAVGNLAESDDDIFDGNTMGAVIDIDDDEDNGLDN